MNDDPNIEPVDLSPTRAELIARVRARGRRIRARRRAGITVLATLVVIAIAVPAVATGSRSSSHSITPAVTTPKPHGDLRIARVLSVRRVQTTVHFGDSCTESLDGKDCYVLGETVITAHDVITAHVFHEADQGWVVILKVRSAAMHRLTSLTNEQAAIVVASRVISAPVVEPGIAETSIQVSGHLTHTQATRIAAQIIDGPTPTDQTVTASIELPGDLTYVAGTGVKGTLVIDNETGSWWRMPELAGCSVPWAIELTKPGSTRFVPTTQGICVQRRQEWKGIVRFPFVLRTTDDGCAGAAVETSCVRGPPLAPGRYTAVFVASAPGWPQPHRVMVTLVAAQPSH